MADMKSDEAAITLSAQYVCTFQPDTDGRYSVRCPAFPELISHGDSLEEARAMARGALALCVQAYQDEGRRLPPSDDELRTEIKEMVPVTLARR